MPSIVVRVTSDGKMTNEEIDQEDIHRNFALGTMTFVGAIDDLQCFLLGTTTDPIDGSVVNRVLECFMHERDVYGTIYVIASDVAGNATDITLEKLERYMKDHVDHRS